ncbi:hypothetical protein XM75_u0057 [Vibrio vulnificus]|uniref:Uncharacterized protein n=1 Tax=Vibrio vulnificus TaxID=672 RepID=A0AAI8ZLH4_VIBVL|nr:hypothetical protein [Vibrio vulnificus]OQK43776.1 hypothetical protein XM75_u0057 [Vibrio vulnificus]CDM12430.1 hypothetical protein [Vibrio vulnificus]
MSDFQALIESNRRLAQSVEGKVAEIDSEVDAAKAQMDKFVADSKGLFVNQFSISNPGGQVKIWKLGRLDFYKNSGDVNAENAYIELMLLNGRDSGDQGTRTMHFSASFRQSFNASHYFVGNYVPQAERYSHFIIAKDVDGSHGYYFLYFVQCQYAVCTIVNLHENTPMSPDFSERQVMKTFGSSTLSSLNWDTDIVQFIEQTDNVKFVYTTRDPANAILTVGKIRYAEMEQITPPAPPAEA